MHGPFLSILYPAWICLLECLTHPQQSNNTNQWQHFSSLKRKDSISVAIDKNSVLCCPVGPIDISKSSHFLVLKNTFGLTGRPCRGNLSFPKKSCIFHLKNHSQNKKALATCIGNCNYNGTGNGNANCDCDCNDNDDSDGDGV